jgi:recombination protein RecT
MNTTPQRALRPYESALAKVAEDFTRTAQGVEWEQEKIFAMQALMKTDFAMQTANRNPLSVRLAMLNVAATGLTLNPAYKYAYLVPRDGAIVLEISYVGLLKIATDCGAIAWGRADVVHAGDTFVYRGPAREPEHLANPFTERGEIVGAYVIAKTTEGDMLCDVMGLAELEKIRSKSDLYARKKSGPWVEWFSEMAKKAVIKRASKTWPKSGNISRLLAAIDVANAAEGGYTLEGEPVATVSAQQAASLLDYMASANVEPAGFLQLFNVDNVDALPAFRFGEAVALLQHKISKQHGGENADC